VRPDGVYLTVGHVIAYCGRAGLRLRPWGAAWSVAAHLVAVDYADDLAALTAGGRPRPALAITAAPQRGFLVGVFDDAPVPGVWPSGRRLGLDTGTGATTATGFRGTPTRSTARSRWRFPPSRALPGGPCWTTPAG